MPLGMITLLVVLTLIYFGTAQRILDRMRLTDRQAIVLLILIGATSFIDIPILSSPIVLTVNVGGAVIPILLCLWLIVTADKMKEKLRSVISALVVGAVVFIGSRYMPNEPETMLVDPKIFYGTIAGVVAYMVGRSRRSAFIGGVLGIVFSDLLHMGMLLNGGVVGTTALGGAGAFDVTMITGLVAVVAAECIGEIRERIVRDERAKIGRCAQIYEFSEELTPDGKERRLKMVSQQDRSTDTKNNENRERGERS